MYRVIRFFTDLKDDNHAYNVGDTFPRAGMVVSEARLEELSGSRNKQNEPLIAKVEGKAKAEPMADGSVEAAPAEEAEKPKRGRKKKG